MRIGVDVGGTKIEAIALDGSREVARMRLETPRDDYPATVDAIGRLVARLEAVAGRGGSVGIGIPGALSPATSLVKNANAVWLNGKPLLRDTEHRLDREVRIANDANCFAVSEAADGAGAGADVVFGVIVGTGTGSGIVVRGQVLTGPNAVAGEWGHNPLPWPEDAEHPGPRCYCGRRGCIETFLSGPGLAADHARHTGWELAPRRLQHVLPPVTPTQRRRSRATKGAWPGRSPASSTRWTPTSSCWEAGSRILRASARTFRSDGPGSSSQTQ